MKQILLLLLFSFLASSQFISGYFEHVPRFISLSTSYEYHLFANDTSTVLDPEGNNFYVIGFSGSNCADCFWQQYVLALSVYHFEIYDDVFLVSVLSLYELGCDCKRQYCWCSWIEFFLRCWYRFRSCRVPYRLPSRHSLRRIRLRFWWKNCMSSSSQCWIRYSPIGSAILLDVLLVSVMSRSSMVATPSTNPFRTPTRLISMISSFLAMKLATLSLLMWRELLSLLLYVQTYKDNGV